MNTFFKDWQETPWHTYTSREELDLYVEMTDERKADAIQEKLEKAIYPRFGLTTDQVFENEEEYESWLGEVWEEEKAEYIASVLVEEPES